MANKPVLQAIFGELSVLRAIGWKNSWGHSKFSRKQLHKQFENSVVGMGWEVGKSRAHVTYSPFLVEGNSRFLTRVTWDTGTRNCNWAHGKRYIFRSGEIDESCFHHVDFEVPVRYSVECWLLEPTIQGRWKPGVQIWESAGEGTGGEISPWEHTEREKRAKSGSFRDTEV